MNILTLIRRTQRIIEDTSDRFMCRVVSGNETTDVVEDFQSYPTLLIKGNDPFLFQVVYSDGKVTRYVNIHYINMTQKHMEKHKYMINRDPHELANEIMTKLSGDIQ